MPLTFKPKIREVSRTSTFVCMRPAHGVLLRGPARPSISVWPACPKSIVHTTNITSPNLV